LNSEHPRGKHKARVFATLGITAENAEELRAALLTAAATADAQRPGSGLRRVADRLNLFWRDDRTFQVHRDSRAAHQKSQ